MLNGKQCFCTLYDLVRDKNGPTFDGIPISSKIFTSSNLWIMPQGFLNYFHKNLLTLTNTFLFDKIVNLLKIVFLSARSYSAPETPYCLQ